MASDLKPKTLRDELSDPSLDGPGPGADDGAYELPSDLDGHPDARGANGDVELETLDDAEFTAIKEAITRPRKVGS